MTPLIMRLLLGCLVLGFTVLLMVEELTRNWRERK